jgi:hypothetical protein
LTIQGFTLEARTATTALKEATMIALGITIVAISVIGIGRSIRTVVNDGSGRVPTRTL